MIPLFAQTETRTFYQASRLGAMDQWWHWLALVAVVLAIILFVTSLYRRDGVDLKRPTRWTLRLLRIAAFAGILIFFLKIEKRTEQKLVKNSRAIVLIDTSQSMGLSDENQNVDRSRIEQVASTLGDGLIEEIRQQHDVVVYGFDQSDRPTELASLPKSLVDDAADGSTEAGATLESKRGWARTMYIVAIIFLLAACAAVAAHLLLGYVVRNQDGESWALLVAIGCLIVAGVFYSVTNLRYPEIGWSQAFGGAAVADPDAGSDTNEASQPTAVPDVDWAQALVPRGAETRLGDAIQFVIDKEQGGPIAGVTVFTDGNANAGVDFREAVSAAQEATIPIHLVGVGSSQRPTNARVVDIEAPAKVYPGDMFTVRGFIQAYGMAGKGLTVKLLSKPVDGDGGDAKVAPGKEDEKIVTLGPEGEVTTVEFQVTPDEMGRRRFTVSIAGAAEDLDDQDNEKSQDVEIVDRKNRVLLIAGGPTREYRFVRTLLFRDRDTKLDVILQSSPAGAAQEADDVLDDLPTEAKDLFDYDCIVAFDADWEAFDLEQIELLDRWVAEKAGGLILVAGPVNMPEWTTLRRDNRATNILKGLYPVTFYSRSVARLARGEISRDANAVMMTPAGEQARFLWLDDSATTNKAAWKEFPGIYSASVSYTHLTLPTKRIV